MLGLIMAILLSLGLSFGASYMAVVSQNPGPASENSATDYGPFE